MQDLSRGFKLVTIWLLSGWPCSSPSRPGSTSRIAGRFRSADGAIEIVRGPDGHYHWPGRINGRPVDFLIDTGATGTAISTALASELELASRRQRALDDRRRAGHRQRWWSPMSSCRAASRAQRLRIAALPGLGDRPLLGMDVLGRLSWSQQRGVLVIKPELGAVERAAVSRWTRRASPMHNG